MATGTRKTKEGDVLFEMPSYKRGAEAIQDALTQLSEKIWVAEQPESSWKEPYRYHPLFLEVEIYRARYDSQDCWLLLKQHDFIGYYMSEIFIISQEFGQKLIEKHSQSADSMLPLRIIITKRGHDCHASIEGHPGIWEAGKTGAEALGKLIQTHGKTLGIEVQWSDDTWTKRYIEGDPLTKS